MLGQKANHLPKRLLQSGRLSNWSFKSKAIKACLFLLISYLSMSCGTQDNIPNINNVMGSINQYEQWLQAEIFRLRNANRLISANSDIRDMTWLLVWDIGGEISIETSTKSESKTYNLANAIKRNGTFLLPSQSDLNNPEGLPENETFRVLEFEYSLREIKGRILRVGKQTLIYMKDAITSQTVFIENTAPVEAFFKLTFARASHSYFINSNSQNAQAMVDQQLRNRQTYVFISHLYWTGINTSASIPGVPGVGISINRGNSGNNLGLRNTPYNNDPRLNTTTPYLDSTLSGKVDVSIDLLSLTETDEHRIINIFFQQTARDFQNPRQVEGVRVILSTNSNDEDLSNFGRTYLRQKTLNPFHFVFDISASQLNASIKITSNVSNLVFINPFEDAGIQRGLISEIGVRKDRGILNKIIVTPLRWLGENTIGRIF